MFSFFKKMRPRTQFFLLVFVTILIGVGCWFFDVAFAEVMGIIISYILALVASGFIYWIHELTEDKKKMSDKNYPYDEKTYCRTVKVGDKVNHVWYRTCVNGRDVKEVDVNDSDAFTYQLDPIIAANFAAILDAHKASFIKNIPMVRLDDYHHDADSGLLTLDVSRTMFYNDLVTNRAMDYEFAGNMTVRDVFESRPHISSLRDSKMSNHIGINALVFYRGHLILAHRGINSTMSKNNITSTVAIGLSEETVIHTRPEGTVGENVELSREDVKRDIILSRLSEAFDSLTYADVRRLADDGYIKVYFLGFGQLLYMGGKPQFYYAVTIQDDCPLPQVSADMKNKKETIDMNLRFIHARSLALTAEDSDTLVIDGRVSPGGKKYQTFQIKAEKSFYVNLMHLREYGHIEGVPAWIYETIE